MSISRDNGRMADVVEFGSEPRPRRWLSLAAGAGLASALVVGVVLYSINGGSGPERTDAVPGSGPAAGTQVPTGAPPAQVPTGQFCLPLGTGQHPAIPDSVAGLRLDGPAGAGLDRCDRAALEGPWTVVVRRPDGSLGRRGAVVVFPVEPPAAGRGVAVGSVTGTAAPNTVTWPIGGRFARIRGDQSEADLIAIAAATTIEANHPAVAAPPPGFVVAATGPYRAPSVHERRYGTDTVGEIDALGGGLTFTGVASGGGFEDVLYTLAVRDGQPVGGRPSVVSSAFGGNATLAWEPAPGLVAYVGYSGSPADDAAVAALQRLAGKAQPMTTMQWVEGGAQIVDQVNEPG